MNKLLNYCGLFLVTIIITYGCSQELDLEVDYAGDKLVVFCELNDPRGLRVTIFHTLAADIKKYNPLEQPPRVRGGQIEIYANEQKILHLTDEDGDGSITYPLLPVDGVKYAFIAYAPGYDTIYSLPEVKTSVPTISGKLINSDHPINRDLEVTIQQDSSSLPQYYNLDVQLSYASGFKDIIGYYQGVDNYAGCVQTRGVDEWHNSHVMFDNQCFLQTKKLMFFGRVRMFDTVTGDTSRYALQSIMCEIKSININYYDFLKNNVHPEGFELAFVEPKISRFNVRGGYGFMVVSNSSVDTLVL